jgi:hypothetical protein
MWAPYDATTYQAVVDCLVPEDTVVEIGAGDLRLARRLVEICRKVYAIEIQESLLRAATRSFGDVPPKNLIVLCADAQALPFPSDVTVGVLLMRHCTHFRLYADKLKSAGASRLITNARWRMGVEVVQISQSRQPYLELPMGWYACWCGAVGFKPGPVDLITPEMDRRVYEVVECPMC